ncbi:hypothetical protein HHI36_020983 [Cryptolaemus montrouzieri]
MNLLGDDFLPTEISGEDKPNQGDTNESLLDLSLSQNNPELISKDFFMPSNLIQGGFNFTSDDLSKLEKAANQKDEKAKTTSDKEKTDAQVSWLSLFDELDPLSNKNTQNQNDDQL